MAEEPPAPCSHVAGETGVAGNGLAVPASWPSQENFPLALDFHLLALLEEVFHFSLRSHLPREC